MRLVVRTVSHRVAPHPVAQISPPDRGDAGVPGATDPWPPVQVKPRHADTPRISRGMKSRKAPLHTQKPDRPYPKRAIRSGSELWQS
jgi:hypothetical protein